jgi:hypothetical protein
MDDAVRIAMERNPVLRLSRLEVDAAEAEVREVRGGRSPRRTTSGGSIAAATSIRTSLAARGAAPRTASGSAPAPRHPVPDRATHGSPKFHARTVSPTRLEARGLHTYPEKRIFIVN